MNHQCLLMHRYKDADVWRMVSLKSTWHWEWPNLAFIGTTIKYVWTTVGSWRGLIVSFLEVGGHKIHMWLETLFGILLHYGKIKFIFFLFYLFYFHSPTPCTFINLPSAMYCCHTCSAVHTIYISQDSWQNSKKGL